MKKVTALFLITVLFWGCEPWDLDCVDIPKLATGTASEITLQSAVINNTIEGLCRDGANDHGLVWSTIDQLPEITSASVDSKGGRRTNGDFSSTLSGLQPNTQYYYRPFAVVGTTVFYGEPASFTTAPSGLQLTIGDVLAFQPASARLSGRFTGLEASVSLSAYGHVWSRSPDPTTADNLTNLGRLSGVSELLFASTLEGLEAGTYFVRSYVTFNGTTYYSQNTTLFKESWEESSPIEPGQSITGSVFTIGNYSYLLNGKDLYRFDAAADQWELWDSSFPGTLRFQAVGFALGGKGYIGTGGIVGGGGSSYLKDFWSFSPDAPPSMRWERIDDLPTEGLGRALGVAFVIGDRAYFGAGYNEAGGSFQGGSKDFFEYSPQSGWRKISSYPGQAGHSLFAFTLDGRAYVGAGYDGVAVGGDVTDDFWVFEPNEQGGTWSPIDFPFPGGARMKGVSFSINDKGYIGLGSTYIRLPVPANGATKDLWEYTPGQGWRELKGLPEDLFPREMVSFVNNNQAYIGQGNDINEGGGIVNTDKFYRFSPDRFEK